MLTITLKREEEIAENNQQTKTWIVYTCISRCSSNICN